MPIYEYSCLDCHEHFEELVRGGEEVRCPHCGSREIGRKMSVCGFVSSSKFVGSSGGSCGSCSKTSCGGCSLAAGK